MGSPPRVRGKVTGSEIGNPLSGITPACAVKSEIQVSHVSARGDHPRVCGEKWLILLICLSWLGSPPRVRGKGCCGSSGT